MAENRKKRTYQPPKVETKEIYEVKALGCDKCPSASNIANLIQCRLGVKRFS